MFSIVLATLSVITHAFFNGMGLALGFTVIYSGAVLWYTTAQNRYANGKSWKEILIPPLIDNWKQAYHQRNNPEDYQAEDEEKVFNHLNPIHSAS